MQIFCKITIKNPYTQKKFIKICTIQKKAVLLHSLLKRKHGEMAEWSIAAVLKTVELRGSGGSNPSLSAKKKKEPAMAPSSFLEKTQGLLNPRTGALISASLERYAKLNFASESLSPRMPVAETRHSRWASVARSVP